MAFDKEEGPVESGPQEQDLGSLIRADGSCVAFVTDGFALFYTAAELRGLTDGDFLGGVLKVIESIKIGVKEFGIS